MSTRYQQSQSYQNLCNYSTSAKPKVNKEGKRKQIRKTEFIDCGTHKVGIYQTGSFLLFSQCHILQVLSLLPSNKHTLWRNHLAVSHNLSVFVNNLPRMLRSQSNVFLSMTSKRQQDLQQYFQPRSSCIPCFVVQSKDQSNHQYSVRVSSHSHDFLSEMKETWTEFSAKYTEGVLPLKKLCLLLILTSLTAMHCEKMAQSPIWC